MGSPRQRRWSHRSSLRDSSSHFQVFGRLLPEVRRRGFEKGDQGYPHLLRSIAPRSRPQEERAQEVRGSRRQSQIPEILPLKKIGRKLQTRCGSFVGGRRTLALAGGSLTWKTPDWTDIYIYLSFIFPLFLTFRLSMIMFKLSFTVLFRDIYEF